MVVNIAAKKAAGKSRSKMQALLHDWRLYLMVLVPIVYYIVFCYKPMYGLVIAFQKYNLFKGVAGSKWVGWDNFEFGASDAERW